MFEPVQTERLLLRTPRMDDLDALVARRSHPEVAALQSWTAPYPVERGRIALESVIEANGPVQDEFWMITVADHTDATVLGDLAVRMQWDGRCAEVGYTFAREHWGNGYAAEAVAGLVAWLFSHEKFTRVFGQLHPDNLASAAVLERTGFLFEGHTRLSYWVEDDNSDDWLYGMTRADWESWTSRPSTPPDQIEFVEVTEANQYDVRALTTHHSQRRLVSPVVNSMADALFPEIIDGAPVAPWMRAVKADDELAAFVMIAEVTDAHPEPYLWRLLVDRRHQRRGIGRNIISALVDDLRAQGATTLLTSWEDGPGSPRPFYEGLGFVATGEIVDGEIEGRLTFS